MTNYLLFALPLCTSISWFLCKKILWLITSAQVHFIIYFHLKNINISASPMDLIHFDDIFQPIFFNRYFSTKPKSIFLIFSTEEYQFFLSPYHDFFTWRIYTFVQGLTKMGFSTFKNLFYPKNIPLCASVLRFFSFKIIGLCAIWLKCCFYASKYFLLKEYTPLCELIKMVFSTLEYVIYPKNIHLCASVFLFLGSMLPQYMALSVSSVSFVKKKI